MKYILYISMFILFFGSTQAFALPQSGTIDKNGDGIITWEEFQASFPGVTKDNFNEIDTDKNGNLDNNEMSVFRNRFGGSRPNGVRGGMGPQSTQQHSHNDGHDHPTGLPVLPSKKK